MKRALAGMLAAAVLGGCAPVPDLEAIRAGHPPSSAWLLDRHGVPLQSTRIDFASRRGEWQPLAEISPAVIRAVVAREDKRFHAHGGVDLRALGHAVWQNLRGEHRRGASTLTMQLAGFLDPALASGARKGSWGKLKQVIAAWRLEGRLDKAEILEAYLNLAPFRGEARGVAAASALLFGKGASALDETEALLLAALLPAPQAPPDVVALRACRYAGQPVESDACTSLRRHTHAVLLVPNAVPAGPELSPHLVARLQPAAGERIQTTLDATLQRRARAALESQLALLADADVEDGAILVVDNASGDVLAYVGSRPQARQHQVDGVRALRQAGSTLKPFLYALALEREILTGGSRLDDAPLSIPTSSGAYVPQNYDRRFRGPVTVRHALAGSLNVPAVRTLMLTGVEPVHQRLVRLGLPLTHDAHFYGPALALGAPEVDLWTLTNAYRSLANGGRSGPLRLRAGSASATEDVIDPAAAFIVADILADRAARSATFGLESPLATPFWSAVKTGTSKDMRDNWCVGFSSRFTVGVWVGNFDGRPMRGVSGVTGAAPVWLEVMQALHATPPTAPKPPTGVVRVDDEWFIAGTAPGKQLPPVRGDGRIDYPEAAAILAIDPDIPPAAQRVFLRARNGQGAVWVLDGERLAPADVPHPWTPLPGAHVLELVAEGSGRTLDRVTFQVRGSGRAALRQ